VVGASLRSAGVRDSLQPQDGLYCLVERDAEREAVRLIGTVQEVLVAPEDPAALVAALAEADVHIVTLTITEKGYLPDPEENGRTPRTAAGFLTAALALRRQRGLPPFTVISCDNVPNNGARLRDAVLAFAGRSDSALADWIAEHGAFPQTMIDRIVPATDETDIERLAARIGLVDRAMVKAEPFTQWVIEDRFAGQRPEFERAGVQITNDVAPWEEAKLRLLNGAHSAIAYLGGLAGIEYVHEFVADPGRRRFVEMLWDEVETTLDPPSALNIAEYRQALMARFSNSALQHRTMQIAMDGSQKIPQRLLATIMVRLGRGQSIRALAIAVAAWIRWQSGKTDSGDPFVVDDPLAATTRRLVSSAGSAADQVRALLTLRDIFPERLASDEQFIDVVSTALSELQQSGSAPTIARLLAD